MMYSGSRKISTLFRFPNTSHKLIQGNTFPKMALHSIIEVHYYKCIVTGYALKFLNRAYKHPPHSKSLALFD